jgi:ComF family protein
MRSLSGCSIARMSFAAALSPLIDLVMPPRCPLCGEGISAQGGLCGDCWSELQIPGEPWCQCCQRPFGNDSRGGDMICGPCLAQPPAHDGIAAATLYNDASRQLVLSLKHARRIALAPMMARLMAARIGTLEGEWVLVPVPLHRARLWHRSFNQAALLARAVGKQLKLPVCVDGLIRKRATPSLGGLGAKARQRTVAAAIVPNENRREELRGAQVILVDDVLTSGATSSACMVALRKAGASKVRIACFARVLDEALLP